MEIELVKNEMKKLIVLFDENNVIPEVCWLFGETNTKYIKELLGNYFSEIIMIMDNHKNAKICCYESEIKKISNDILKKIIQNPEWGDKIAETIINNSDEIILTIQKHIKDTNLNKLSDAQLFELFETFYNLSIQQFVSGSIPMLLEIHTPLLTNYLMEYLKNKTKTLTELNEVFIVLTSPTKRTSLGEEEIDFLKLANEILSDDKKDLFKINISLNDFKSKFPKEYLKLKDHHQKYFWLPHDFLGELWDLNFFYEKLLDLGKSELNVNDILIQKIKKPIQLKNLQNEFVKKYNINNKFQDLFSLARKFMYTKPYRKEKFTYSFYYLYKLYDEIARRFGYSLNQVRWISHIEKKNLLINHILVDKKLLDKREMGCVLFCEDGNTSINYNFEYFKKRLNQLELSKNLKQIKGTCASRGIVKGAVKKIYIPEDMKKMKKGDILVAPNTNPDIITAMKVAGAIITNQGGMTCHAAIVSREFGIPCIVGTNVATEILNDNDLIEVDANHGIVRILKKS